MDDKHEEGTPEMVHLFRRRVWEHDRPSWLRHILYALIVALVLTLIIGEACLR